ncbi:probable arylsulfate sulfotransferase [Salmonella enterica subsp. enterica]|nr:probable arylsulfate sulfotransferase [Salmonella enterica subsp. enterica]
MVQTSAIVNHYMDNRSISDLQQTKVIKVAPGFEDRLYLVNTHTFTPQGAEFHWHGEKDKNAGILDAGPAGGCFAFRYRPLYVCGRHPGWNIAGGWIKIPSTTATI